MKRLLLYTGIGVAILVAIFLVMVLGAVAIANNETERENYSYIVGYSFGLLLMIVAGGTIIFGMFKLTITVFFKKEETNDNEVLDKDGPIDRYLK